MIRRRLTAGEIAAAAGTLDANATLTDIVGTVRSASRDTWAQLPDVVPPAISGIAELYGVKAEVNYVQGVPPVVNDEACAQLAAQAVTDVLGEDGVGEADQSSGGEDFGWYTEEIPGIYLRLGVWDGDSDETDLHVRVKGVRRDGTVVIEGVIKLYVSPKPAKN